VSRSRRRLPVGVILTAAIVVVLIPTLAPDDWLPADKTTRDLVLAGVMIGVLAVILGGWFLFGGKRD